MKRRTFIRATGAAATAGVLAGCTSGTNAPPPRRSEVVNQISADGTTFEVDLESEATVQSRARVDSEQNTLNEEAVSDAVQGALALYADLSIIGVAAAKGRGRGAAAAAATGAHGRPKWAGGDHDDWREEHADEVRNYPAMIAALGVAHLAGPSAGEDTLPGPGPVPWDKEWIATNVAARSDRDEEEEEEQTTPESTSTPSEQEGSETTSTPATGGEDDDGSATTPTETTPATQTEGGDDVERRETLNGAGVNYDFDRPGWYRIATHLIHPSGRHDFGWESVDVLVEADETGEYQIAEKWKVSPRL